MKITFLIVAFTLAINFNAFPNTNDDLVVLEKSKIKVEKSAYWKKLADAAAIML